MERLQNQTFQKERDLYGIKNTIIDNCEFKGEEDGESVLKETRNIEVRNSGFYLRYPIWHTHGFKIDNSIFGHNSRAAFWYSSDGTIVNSKLLDVKALRECSNVNISNSEINSVEFGWRCDNINIVDSDITSEYVFFESRDVALKNIKFKGKYSFQYVNNLRIDDSNLDTKDAFWHSNNTTIRNSIVKGEYLAWYSNNLTMIDCVIIGTQPFCYCKNLKLIRCKMIDTDLAFENSDVDADVIGGCLSIKRPHSGTITIDEMPPIVEEASIFSSDFSIKLRGSEQNTDAKR